jgi:hypothetical protein
VSLGGFPLDHADSIRRPHVPQASSPASRYRRCSGMLTSRVPGRRPVPGPPPRFI